MILAQPGDGEDLVVNAGMGVEITRYQQLVNALIEEFLDHTRVSVAAVEVVGHVEGLGARRAGEIVGVQHDARQQQVSLLLVEGLGVRTLLKDLGDDLAGRGLGGLDIVEEGGEGKLIHQAVVVDDRDGGYSALGGDTADQLGSLKNIGIVDVGDDEDCVGGDQLLGGGFVDEDASVLGESAQMLGADGEGVAGFVGDDVNRYRFLPLSLQNTAAQAVCAHGRSNGVKVGIGVSHDEDAVAVGQVMLQEAGTDTGGNGGVGLHGLVGPAEVGQTADAASLKSHLVTASLESHVQSGGGGFFLIPHTAVDVGNAHGDREGEGVIAHADVHDVVQNGEAVPDAGVQPLSGEEGQVLVAVVLPEHTVHALHPGGEGLLDEVGGGAVIGADELGQLLEVIQHDIGQNHPLAVGLLGKLQVVVDVAEQQEVVVIPLSGHEVAVHAVASSVGETDDGVPPACLGGGGGENRGGVFSDAFGGAGGGGGLLKGDAGAELGQRDVADGRAEAQDTLEGGIDDPHHAVAVDHGVGNVHLGAKHPIDVPADLLGGLLCPLHLGVAQYVGKQNGTRGDEVEQDNRHHNEGKAGELQVGHQGDQTEKQESLGYGNGEGNAEIHPHGAAGGGVLLGRHGISSFRMSW